MPLFYDFNKDELHSVLACLNSRYKSYPKGDFVFFAGDKNSSVCIVISGKVQIFKEDFLGNKNIMTEVSEGEMFAEVFSCANINRIPVSVQALTDSTIMFLDYNKIMTLCSRNCQHHYMIIKNMLSILANKNMLLNEKIEHISKRTTREKIVSYLSACCAKKGSDKFKIPFGRQEMADFLCVDRSALSTELGKLKKEGKINFKKNEFKILDML